MMRGGKLSRLFELSICDLQEFASQDVVVKLLADPCGSQGLFFNLGVAFLCLGHGA